MGSMASSFASHVATTMAEKQKANVVASQDRMQRNMLLMQMAVARERFYWFGGVWCVLTTGLTAAMFKAPERARVALVPYFIFSTVCAYQYDFAYGNKVERIRAISDDMQKSEVEQHWFLPVERP